MTTLEDALARTDADNGNVYLGDIAIFLQAARRMAEVEPMLREFMDAITKYDFAEPGLYGLAARIKATMEDK
jgi:hypothetical protein